MKIASGSLSPCLPHKYAKSPTEAINGDTLADGRTFGRAISSQLVVAQDFKLSKKHQ